MEQTLTRTKLPKKAILQKAMEHPLLLVRELTNRSFYEFFKFFWPEYSSEKLELNWHIEVLCDELQELAERVAQSKIKEHDLIINIPPGMTKTAICSIMFPVWCWTRWYWMKFITISYSASLSLESAEYSRDLIQSDRFSSIYPELGIKDDKNTKTNFRVVKKIQEYPGRAARVFYGGNRYSTSVEGTLTGFHAHILIVDDPINPQQAVSKVELEKTNRWLSQTLPTRKVNKAVSPMVLIMQRLHQNDPSGYLLEKKKTNLKHICLPGEIRNYKKQVKPVDLLLKYDASGLLDPKRLSDAVLTDLEADLGQYSYAGQIGQSPTPPAGGMFKADRFPIVETLPISVNFMAVVRYWDKAGTKEQADGKGSKAAWTVGTKMIRLTNGKFIIVDVKRGRWAAEEREAIIRSIAEADGKSVKVYFEQEPGSGGKESAEATIKNLAGFAAYADLPKGDKIYRADPYSVQVNNGNVLLLKGDWNTEFIDEHRHFPNSTYKDQVDSAGGAFSKLTAKRRAKIRNR